MFFTRFSDLLSTCPPHGQDRPLASIGYISNFGDVRVTIPKLIDMLFTYPQSSGEKKIVPRQRMIAGIIWGNHGVFEMETTHSLLLVMSGRRNIKDLQFDIIPVRSRNNTVTSTTIVPSARLSGGQRNVPASRAIMITKVLKKKLKLDFGSSFNNRHRRHRQGGRALPVAEYPKVALSKLVPAINIYYS